MSAADTLHTWHDFFLLMGGASATLVGLVFLTVSLAVDLPKLPQPIDRTLFTTPIVAQYGYALGISALSVIPYSAARPYAVTITVVSLAASVQMTWVIRMLVQRHAAQTVTARYWLWNAVMPLLAVVLLLSSGAWMLQAGEVHVGGVAAAVLILALTGVRNSWLLVMWFLEQRHAHASRSGAPPASPP